MSMTEAEIMTEEKKAEAEAEAEAIAEEKKINVEMLKQTKREGKKRMSVNPKSSRNTKKRLLLRKNKGETLINVAEVQDVHHQALDLILHLPLLVPLLVLIHHRLRLLLLRQEEKDHIDKLMEDFFAHRR